MSQKVNNNDKKRLVSEFGRNLKFLRRLTGMTQTQFAETVGMSRSNTMSYESGLVEPNLKRFFAICDQLSVDPRAMIEDDVSITMLESQEQNQDDVQENFIRDNLQGFISHTREMTKILNGYRALQTLNTRNQSPNSTLEQLLDLLEMLIRSNWSMLRSIYSDIGEIE